MYQIVPMDNSAAAVYAGEPFHLRIFEPVEAYRHHLCLLFHGAEVWLVTLPSDEPEITLLKEFGKVEDLEEIRYVHTGSVNTTPYSTTFYVGAAGTKAIREKLMEEGITEALTDTMIAPRRVPGGQIGPLIYWRIFP